MWDARRERLCAELRRQDAVCGDLYRRAIDTMSADPLTEVDLMVTAQAMRELVNRFPRFSGTQELKPGRSTGADVEKFVGVWETYNGKVEATDEESVVRVPRSVIAAAQELATNFYDGNVSNMRLRSALVLGRADVDSDPAVTEVARAIKKFERVRHPQGDTAGWLDTDAPKVRAAIEVVENALEARLGSFFGVVDQLKEILERANTTRQSPDGAVTWPRPDEQDLRDVVSRLGDVQHRRVFFGALRNPLWLDPLNSRGLFSRIPEHQVDTDGRWVWLLWPEGEYLAAIAAAVPARVVEILKQAVKAGAAHDARRQLLKAAVAMPPDHAATLASTLQPFIEPAMDLQFAFDLIGLIEKLTAGGKRRQARKLAWELLRPRAGAEGWFGTDVESAIDRHWYAEAMDESEPLSGPSRPSFPGWPIGSRMRKTSRAPIPSPTATTSATSGDPRSADRPLDIAATMYGTFWSTRSVTWPWRGLPTAIRSMRSSAFSKNYVSRSSGGSPFMSWRNASMRRTQQTRRRYSLGSSDWFARS